MKIAGKAFFMILTFALLLTILPEVYAEGGIQEGRELIASTGDDIYIQLPEEDSFLKEFKVMYAFNKNVGPCSSVEKFPKKNSGATMPYAYDGTKVTVVAEQDGMSCIVYHDSTDKIRTGWIQSANLQEDFPGKVYCIGEHRDGGSMITEVPMEWSRKAFLYTQQNYTVLAKPVMNCIGFTLEYQLIKENTDKWEEVLGPRIIFVKSGEDWIEVGSFEYPEFGPVKVELNFEEPMTIEAVGTIADCNQPNLFSFRQLAYDYRLQSESK